MNLKILSWNIWYDGDFEKISKFISESNADIVGLQEVVPDDPSRDTTALMKSLGYQQVLAPVLTIKKDGRTMANGFFSKYPIVESKIHILPCTKTDRRNAIQADIDVDGRIFHVFVTHLVHTHQKPDPTQESQVENLIKLLTKENTIVMGDFNATPESRTIQSMKKVLVDTDPTFAPTWSVYPEGCAVCDLQKKIDTRLDYIFLSKDLKNHSFKVGDSDASDHLPISVVVGIV